MSLPVLIVQDTVDKHSIKSAAWG